MCPPSIVLLWFCLSRSVCCALLLGLCIPRAPVALLCVCQCRWTSNAHTPGFQQHLKIQPFGFHVWNTRPVHKQRQLQPKRPEWCHCVLVPPQCPPRDHREQALLERCFLVLCRSLCFSNCFSVTDCVSCLFLVYSSVFFHGGQWGCICTCVRQQESNRMPLRVIFMKEGPSRSQGAEYDKHVLVLGLCLPGGACDETSCSVCRRMLLISC